MNATYFGQFDIGFVSFEPQHFLQYANGIGRDDLNEDFLRKDLLILPAAALRLYRHYLRQLRVCIRRNPSFMDLPHASTLIVEDVIPLLVDAIPIQNHHCTNQATPLRRAALIRKVQDYMQEHIDEPLTLQKICEALGTSRTALKYGFQQLLGVSPMAYLKVQRLHGARRALKLHDPKTTSVTAIAQQWGFWNLGHFGQAYKALFGELPSQTLRR